MATKKKTTAKRCTTARKKTTAITLSNVALTPQQQSVILSRTPEQFIKEREGRGGKVVKYVEGGYVVNKLNQAFGALNWEFKVLDRIIDGQDVVVHGALTVKDHVNGYAITKEQYGQHQIAKNVPLGDTIKAAATDALKKCASLFGIALDVYWQQLDEENGTRAGRSGAKKSEMTQAEAYQRSKEMILECRDVVTLREWRSRIAQSRAFQKPSKEKLIALIDAQIKKYAQGAA